MTLNGIANLGLLSLIYFLIQHHALKPLNECYIDTDIIPFQDSPINSPLEPSGNPQDFYPSPAMSSSSQTNAQHRRRSPSPMGHLPYPEDVQRGMILFYSKSSVTVLIYFLFNRRGTRNLDELVIPTVTRLECVRTSLIGARYTSGHGTSSAGQFFPASLCDGREKIQTHVDD